MAKSDRLGKLLVFDVSPSVMSEFFTSVDVIACLRPSALIATHEVF